MNIWSICCLLIACLAFLVYIKMRKAAIENPKIVLVKADWCGACKYYLSKGSWDALRDTIERESVTPVPDLLMLDESKDAERIVSMGIAPNRFPSVFYVKKWSDGNVDVSEYGGNVYDNNEILKFYSNFLFNLSCRT